MIDCSSETSVPFILDALIEQICHIEHLKEGTIHAGDKIDSIIDEAFQKAEIFSAKSFSEPSHRFLYHGDPVDKNAFGYSEGNKPNSTEKDPLKKGLRLFGSQIKEREEHMLSLIHLDVKAPLSNSPGDEIAIDLDHLKSKCLDQKNNRVPLEMEKLLEKIWNHLPETLRMEYEANIKQRKHFEYLPPIVFYQNLTKCEISEMKRISLRFDDLGVECFIYLHDLEFIVNKTFKSIQNVPSPRPFENRQEDDSFSEDHQFLCDEDPKPDDDCIEFFRGDIFVRSKSNSVSFNQGEMCFSFVNAKDLKERRVSLTIETHTIICFGFRDGLEGKGEAYLMLTRPDGVQFYLDKNVIEMKRPRFKKIGREISIGGMNRIQCYKLTANGDLTMEDEDGNVKTLLSCGALYSESKETKTEGILSFENGTRFSVIKPPVEDPTDSAISVDATGEENEIVEGEQAVGNGQENKDNDTKEEREDKMDVNEEQDLEKEKETAPIFADPPNRYSLLEPWKSITIDFPSEEIRKMTTREDLMMFIDFLNGSRSIFLPNDASVTYGCESWEAILETDLPFIQGSSKKLKCEPYPGIEICADRSEGHLSVKLPGEKCIIANNGEIFTNLFCNEVQDSVEFSDVAMLLRCMTQEEKDLESQSNADRETIENEPKENTNEPENAFTSEDNVEKFENVNDTNKDGNESDVFSGSNENFGKSESTAASKNNNKEPVIAVASDNEDRESNKEIKSSAEQHEAVDDLESSERSETIEGDHDGNHESNSLPSKRTLSSDFSEESIDTRRFEGKILIDLEKGRCVYIYDGAFYFYADGRRPERDLYMEPQWTDPRIFISCPNNQSYEILSYLKGRKVIELSKSDKMTAIEIFECIGSYMNDILLPKGSICHRMLRGSPPAIENHPRQSQEPTSLKPFVLESLKRTSVFVPQPEGLHCPCIIPKRKGNEHRPVMIFREIIEVVPKRCNDAPCEGLQNHDLKLAPLERYLKELEIERKRKEEQNREEKERVVREQKEKIKMLEQKRKPWPKKKSRFDDCPTHPKPGCLLKFFETKEGIMALDTILAHPSNQSHHFHSKPKIRTRDQLQPGVYLSRDLPNCIALEDRSKKETEKGIVMPKQEPEKDFQCFALKSTKAKGLIIEPNHVHFGTVQIGKTVEENVLLTNRSNKLTRIAFQTSNPCLSISSTYGPLPCGLSRRIHLSFRSMTPLNFIAEIRIKSEYGDSILTCSAKAIDGNVI